MAHRIPLPPDLLNDLEAVSRVDAVRQILEVVCSTTGLGFSAVARVTDEKWVACAVRDEIAFGLKPGDELELKSTICHEIRQHRQVVVIDRVDCDPLYKDHHTPKRYGLQSYISVPIMLPSGEFFGTLCAIDSRPAKVNTPATIKMFRLFADLIARHLDTELRLSEAEDAATLREQFIAVLGHDLRNPLNAIVSANELLTMLIEDESHRDLLRMIDRSSKRMAELIGNVMDLARGRNEGRVQLEWAEPQAIAGVIAHACGELKQAHSARAIDCDLRITSGLRCDCDRLGQLTSNLVANALTHGAADGPIHIRATTEAGVFELSVSNQGEPIPPDVQAKLFRPFTRGTAGPNREGLGLGLYIASDIGRGHGGELSVQSDADETRFTFRMPLEMHK